MTPFDIVFTLATEAFVPTFIVLLLIIAGIYAVKKQPISAITFIGFGGTLAAGEGASIYFTGKTISENHWLMDAADPTAGLTMFLLLSLLLLIIVVHLGKLTIGRYRKKEQL